MGGRGSGRHQGFGVTTVEEVKSIDLSYLRRKGLLEPGTWSGLQWSWNGEPWGSIRFAVEADAIRLMYRARTRGNDEWDDIDERIPLVWTWPHLGGRRAWFRCPICQRCCRILYGGVLFRCRVCHGYRHASQCEPPHLSALAQAQKIRRRLGGPGDIFAPFPDKPKGMHWRTYARLRHRGQELEARSIALLMARVGIEALP